MISITHKIKESTSYVVSKSEHVKINKDYILKEAENLLTQKQMLKELNEFSQWDSNLHYTANDDSTAQYILILDAINFCFWPQESTNWDYDVLAKSLKESYIKDSTILNADRLVAFTKQDFTKIFPVLESERMIDERVRLIQEVGFVLLAYFNGSAANFVRSANQSADELVKLVTQYFPGFRDETIYYGKQIFIYKRAQIFVGDIWGAYGGKSLGMFHDIHKLTTFADYRVPQLLRELNIMEYSATLSQTIAEKQVIQPNSREEIEIRAATIQSVEIFQQVLTEKNYPLTSIQLDWYLWRRAENLKEKMAPHHRVLTIFY